MPRIELLLAGPFRTGAVCAAGWLNQSDAHVNIFTTTKSKEEAARYYPDATIVTDDYTEHRVRTKKMFLRWAAFVQHNYESFTDDQLCCISRPDFFIQDNIWERYKMAPPGDLHFLPVWDSCLVNDAIFFCTFKVLKKLIVDESTYETPEFPGNRGIFSPHEYLYYFGQHNHMKQIIIIGRICRPNTPRDTPIDIDVICKYEQDWANFIRLFREQEQE